MRKFLPQDTDWRSPEMLLLLMAVAMPLSFASWRGLLNNFAVEAAAFDGQQIGILQSVREVPGFLSFAVVFILLFIRQQPLAVLSLLFLGVGVAMTGLLPSFWGLLFTTFIMSIGFHYFETTHQSLTLQWIDKDRAPEVFGRIISARSIASAIAFGIIFVALEWSGVAYTWVYLVAGGVTVVIALYCWKTFPEFKAATNQRKTLVFRQRYWLWYALTFMSGARRQIFVVFAVFLMVEKFDFSASDMSLLFLVNMGATFWLAPKIGRFVQRFGERRTLIIEYTGLLFVFTGYAFATEVWMGVGLYLLDHVFFAMALAIKTYFQKIADPADIASSTGISFTLSHIAAVVIPAAFGFLWLVSPAYVFLAGTAMAGVSLVFALMVPRHPTPENVALVSFGKTVPVGAE
ncbi:MAG: MFS transporter [Rhodospirillaceae bacterium]|nr:MFS transporter [Rhodospirillaceae bacterium]